MAKVLVSTKGRYALRVMVDLAQQPPERFVPLKEIAARQEISEKYLESILVVLSKAGYVTGVRGKGGGYRLTQAPQAYTVGSILKLTDGALAPVACLEPPQNPCPRAPHCPTLPMWSRLNRLMDDFLEGVTLQELATGSAGA